MGGADAKRPMVLVIINESWGSQEGPDEMWKGSFTVVRFPGIFSMDSMDAAGHPSSISWLNTKSLWLEINDKGHGDDIHLNDVLGTTTRTV